MGYKRHVVTSTLPYDHFSIAIDETRAAFRVLDKKIFFEVPEDTPASPIEELTTTQKLGERGYTGKANRFYQINGEDYCILAEIIIDKTVPEFQKLWVPGAHFVTWLNNNRLHAIIKGALTYFDCRNTAEYVRHEGGMWAFDLWVRDPNAPLTECARSITTAEDTTVITNLEDLGEVWTAADVMTGTTSKWLNLEYSLTPSSETVAPDGWVDFTLTLKDGKTHAVATDVTWDGYIVEAVDGYAPHKRVAVTNGVGHFRACALGLQAGETMRIKINHRFYTSRAEATVQVVSDD